MPAALVRVAVLSPPYSTLTYSLPEHFPAAAFFIGQRAAAPLGRSLRLGVVLASGKAEDLEEGQAIKPLLWPLDKKPLISPAYLDLALQLSARHTESPGRVLASLLPAGLRSVRLRLRFFGDGKARELSLSALAGLEADELTHCAALWQQGLAKTLRAGLSPLDAEVCTLTADPPWPVRPAAKAQIALLEYLLEHGLVTRRKLNEVLGRDAGATLTLLADRGLVRIVPADDENGADAVTATAAPPVDASAAPAAAPAAFALTLEQRSALDSLGAALSGGQAQSSLLFGITGSGKTAVYLELAKKTLALGRSVMLLAPEVALAHKLWADVAALPELYPSVCKLLLYHGYQAQAQRERVFRELAEESAQDKDAPPRLVVGTRSALLLPLNNVGLIVLDEEHDASFKQDEGFIYQAKEVAWYRALQDRALLLLGSATPDIKSFHAASRGLIPMHVLRGRVGGGSLPTVELVPLAGRAAKSTVNEPLAPQSLAALNESVARGEQAIIMLNRRGYAPVMYCLACNAVAKCPHCDIALAYHKGRERLLCHYCGFAAPFPSPCAACQGMHFLPMGEGTEKLEESLGPLLPPGTGILRLDRDSARRPGRMEAILAAFARKEAQVLVGTQMLSKGHHFPDVTLAIVADADLGLNLPDYRAAERTFQLLLQSAGRAGRGGGAGRVLIQTRDPGHYCWDFVLRADYEGFFARELDLRRRRHYPPFARLALIRISHAANLAQGPELVMGLGRLLRPLARQLKVTLLGPAPAPLALLKGRRRWHCLLKADDWPPLRALFSEARSLSDLKHLRIRLDLDPVNML